MYKAKTSTQFFRTSKGKRLNRFVDIGLESFREHDPKFREHVSYRVPTSMEILENLENAWNFIRGLKNLESAWKFVNSPV